MGKNWKTRTTTPRAPRTASRHSGVLHRTGMVCLTESPHLATCGARRSRASRAIRRMAISKTGPFFFQVVNFGKKEKSVPARDDNVPVQRPNDNDENM